MNYVPYDPTCDECGGATPKHNPGCSSLPCPPHQIIGCMKCYVPNWTLPGLDPEIPKAQDICRCDFSRGRWGCYCGAMEREKAAKAKPSTTQDLATEMMWARAQHPLPDKCTCGHDLNSHLPAGGTCCVTLVTGGFCKCKKFT